MNYLPPFHLRFNFLLLLVALLIATPNTRAVDTPKCGRVCTVKKYGSTRVLMGEGKVYRFG